jgi:hypothetical protein
MGQYLPESPYSQSDTLTSILTKSPMLSKVSGADPQQAMDALFADPINSIKWFLGFIGSCMIIPTASLW